jgi:oligosaccharide repeat unit polymerase
MSSLDVALFFFLLLTALNYRAQRSVLYPPFLFCAMWFLDLAVLRCQFIEVDLVHDNTLLILGAAATLFSAGGLLAGLTPHELLRIHLFPVSTSRHPRFLRKLLVAILLCGLPILFYQVFQLAQGVGGWAGFLMQARQAQVDAAMSGQEIHSFVLDYFLTIAIFASLLFATEKTDRQFWIVTGIAFMACILSTGRTSLLLLISGLSAVRLQRSRKETLMDAARLLRWPIALFIAMYVGLIFINKNTEGLVGGTAEIATYYVVSYIVGPLAAFDAVVQRPGDFIAASSHTFEFPLKAAAALHLTDYTPPPKFDSFVMVPFPTNVYTVFKYYFLELGLAGTLTLMLVIGLLHSLLYLKARQGGRLSMYLFAFSLYSVFMVIFDDAYYTLGTYLRAFAFGLLYFAVGSVRLRLLPAFKPAPSSDCASDLPA